MLHLCVSGPVYVLDDVEVVLTNREVHFTFTTCIYFCSRNLLRIMVKINSAKSISEIREISIRIILVVPGCPYGPTGGPFDILVDSLGSL